MQEKKRCNEDTQLTRIAISGRALHPRLLPVVGDKQSVYFAFLSSAYPMRSLDTKTSLAKVPETCLQIVPSSRKSKLRELCWPHLVTLGAC